MSKDSINKIEENPLEALIETEKLEKRRRERKPFGSSLQKLAYAPREGYYRRWFNDIPGRVQKAKDAGFEHVNDPLTGKPESRVVGVQEGGAALYAYLMETPQEWHDEDMADEQKKVDDMERSIKEGRVNIKPGDNRYIPGQGINIRRV